MPVRYEVSLALRVKPLYAFVRLCTPLYAFVRLCTPLSGPVVLCTVTPCLCCPLAIEGAVSAVLSWSD